MSDFLEDIEEGFTPSDLEHLGAMIETLEIVQETIETMEAELKKANERERLLSREQIPDLLLSRGLSEIKTADGKKVIVKEKIACGVPKDPVKKKTVLLWIVENGGSSIIDKILTVEDPEQRLKDQLLQAGVPFKNEASVHYMRFRSFLSEKLGLKKGSLAEIEPTDVPVEANLFIYKETTIK